MNTRRQVMLGGALTILFGGSKCSSAAGRILSGCLLSNDDARRLLATASGQQLFVTGKEPVIRSSGSRDFDYALAQSLAMMADTLNVLPGFAFYDDRDDSNAFATSERTLARSDGTVLFGTGLLKSLLALGEHPEMAVAMVCAHEFGHIVQFKRGLMRKLQGWDPTARRVELHADFLAGYFAGVRKVQRPTFPAVVFATTARGVGSYDISHPDYHGTPADRAAAVVQGFLAAFRDRRTLGDAIETGVNYVRSV
jgi:hypothetical protein